MNNTTIACRTQTYSSQGTSVYAGSPLLSTICLSVRRQRRVAPPRSRLSFSLERVLYYTRDFPFEEVSLYPI